MLLKHMAKAVEEPADLYCVPMALWVPRLHELVRWQYRGIFPLTVAAATRLGSKETIMPLRRSQHSHHGRAPCNPPSRPTWICMPPCRMSNEEGPSPASNYLGSNYLGPNYLGPTYPGSTYPGSNYCTLNQLGQPATHRPRLVAYGRAGRGGTAELRRRRVHDAGRG